MIQHKPIAKKRHRVFQRNSKVCVYDPQNSEKLDAKWQIASQMRNQKLSALKGAVSLKLMSYVSIPTSFSRKKRESLENSYTLTKPDLDNYLKFYLDVLNGIAYDDDKQVVQIFSEKRYSENPRVIIELEGTESCTIM